MVNAAFETGLAQGIVFERRLFHGLFGTEDQKEGMAAFVDKTGGGVEGAVAAHAAVRAEPVEAHSCAYAAEAKERPFDTAQARTVER